ncbi:unnamed protein product [Rodentolepis nana]|uniref:Uncharacterized protein n=1 Tax=Rodentolepis nana TaxID=102285 RepID=A0A0R3TGR5_RODNA|nr:unnamed protein product [Rodentolepis nana]
MKFGDSASAAIPEAESLAVGPSAKAIQLGVASTPTTPIATTKKVVVDVIWTVVPTIRRLELWPTNRGHFCNGISHTVIIPHETLEILGN